MSDGSGFDGSEFVVDEWTVPDEVLDDLPGLRERLEGYVAKHRGRAHLRLVASNTRDTDFRDGLVRFQLRSDT